MCLCSLPNLMTPRFTWSPTLGTRSPTCPAGSPAQFVLLQPSWLRVQAHRRSSRHCCSLPTLAAPWAHAPHRHPTAVSSHSWGQGHWAAHRISPPESTPTRAPGFQRLTREPLPWGFRWVLGHSDFLILTRQAEVLGRDTNC